MLGPVAGRAAGDCRIVRQTQDEALEDRLLLCFVPQEVFGFYLICAVKSNGWSGLGVFVRAYCRRGPGIGEGCELRWRGRTASAGSPGRATEGFPLPAEGHDAPVPWRKYCTGKTRPARGWKSDKGSGRFLRLSGASCEGKRWPAGPKLAEAFRLCHRARAVPARTSSRESPFFY